MDELKKEIGERIKQCRKEKGMTQKELAKEVGCHEGTIRQYENGLRSPRLVSQYAIAKALSVPHESLFTLSAPCAQLSTNLAEVGTDCISRQAAIDAIDVLCQEHRYKIPGKGETYSQYNEAWQDALDRAEGAIGNLPSAEPEHTCVNCGRTANNGGWYADGRTRCPIEEHYALPKDGYCHLWEKRNVTDDDYPERREE